MFNRQLTANGFLVSPWTQWDGLNGAPRAAALSTF